MSLKHPASLLRFLAACGLAALAAPAHAQTVGVTDISATHNNGTIFRSAGQLLGQSFTTDNSASQFNLTSVGLIFYSITGTITDFTVNIRSDSSSAPGSVLGTLTGTSSPTANSLGQQYSFVNGGSLLLSPSTTYWVTWGYSAPTGGGTFFGSPVADTTATGQWSLGANKASTDGGGTWPSPANGSFPLQVSIQATAIPEPGAYAAILGVVVLGAVASRRRRAAIEPRLSN